VGGCPQPKNGYPQIGAEGRRQKAEGSDNKIFTLREEFEG
jgi:hypothetical protein